MGLFKHAAIRPASALPRSVTGVALFLAVLVAVFVPALPAAATTGAISGVAFEDVDRNGVRGPGERPLADQQLYLFDPTGTYAGTTVTDADGRYAFADLTAGTYRVQYAAASWWPLREAWVPTTTGTIKPSVTAAVNGPTTVDFGWRPLVRSTDVDTPVSVYTGTTGLRVESFNDAVPASEIYSTITQGSVGGEAPSVVVRFGFSDTSSTSSSASYRDGHYGTFAAISWVSYLSWLEQDANTLTHEYGHAWSQYHAHMTSGDPAMTSYLQARGLAGDSRVGSSYQWDPAEMIAEDYRQLLGPPSARGFAQMNRSIPPARDVAGLEHFLRETFTRPVQPAPTPTATPTPTPSPTASPTPTPTPTVSPSPSPSPSPTPTAPSKGSKGGGSSGPCRKQC